MNVNEFLSIMQKVHRFKSRLSQENIVGHQRDIIVKIYINDLTQRINTNLLKVV